MYLSRMERLILAFWSAGNLYGVRGLGKMPGIHWFIERRKIRKVTAGSLSCNKGMIRIMERSGMQCEAIRANQELLDGEPLDINYYAKYRHALNDIDWGFCMVATLI